MATLNEYFRRHRTKGFEELARKSGTKLSYLLQLNYNPDRKRPSIDLATKLIEASNGELTYEGLANPNYDRVERSSKKKTAEG